MSELRIRITKSSTTFSAMLIEDEKFPRGGLDATLQGPSWYLSRLIVRPEARGNSFGRKMVEALQQHVGDKAIEVYPGGYDMEPEKIHAFYRHMGFREVEPDVFVWQKSVRQQETHHADSA